MGRAHPEEGAFLKYQALFYAMTIPLQQPTLRDMVKVTVIHYLPRTRLQLSGDSYALLSDSPCATAVVFVHGFWGHSEKTWRQFQTLPDKLDVWWHSCDLFFYSYDSTGIQVWPNISRLNRFLHDVFPEPRWDSLGSDPGPARSYRDIVLVGHSEGAVLIRGTVIELARRHAAGCLKQPRDDPQNNGLLQAGLCLFAPALFGALICGWKGVLLRSPVFGDLVDCCLNRLPAYQHLQANSPVLVQIRNETIELAEKFNTLRALRARTLFAGKDTVACICGLPGDFPPEYEPEATHTTVCKPSPNYLRPVTFVKDVLYAIAA